jgi:integrase
MRFTKSAIAALVMPEGKTEHLEWDPDCPGFGARLRASGSLTWFIQYRFGGKQRRESLGDVRKVSLDDARRIARQRFAKLELGVDPATERAQATQAQALTLGVVADRYIEAKRDRWRPSSRRINERHFNRFWKPLHDCPLEMIKRADVAAQLQDISKTAGRRSASLARKSLAAMYTWAMKEGLCENNPVLATNNPVEGVLPRDRVLSDAEIRVIWNACEDDNFGRIVKLLLLTGCRRNEISLLQWHEIDLDAGVLTIPGERTKNHRTLTLRLPEPALDLLRSQPRKHDDYVFIGGRGGTWLGMQSHSTYRLKAKIIEVNGKPLAPWVLHDLRRTVRTGLSRIGVAPHIAELVINHVRTGVQAVYDRHQYEREIGEALARWADHVVAAVEGRDAKVVAMPRCA